MSIKSVDLFSGAGGLAEGFRRSQITSVVASDFDKMAAKTFTHNHPEVPFVQKSVTDLTGAELLSAAGCRPGEIEIVAGGPPCQGFSIAGQRVVDDPRNRLFTDFVRVVEEIQPKAVLFENVQGIVSMQRGAVVNAIVGRFSNLGYKCQWRVLDASDFGVPQARPRFIMIAVQPGIDFSFPSPTHIGNSDQSDIFGSNLPRKLTVWDALSDLPEIDQGEGEEEQFHSGVYLNEYQKARRGCRNPGSIFNHRATKHSALIQERYAAIPEGKNNTNLPERLRTKKINVYKLDRQRPSRTVTCNHRTDLLHPVIPRGTTVREAARLQSFDDDYRFFGNLTRKAAWVTQDDQVGNAVPPLLAEAIGRSLNEALLSVNVNRSLGIAV